MAHRINHINKSPYPDHVIETIARCLWPDIQTFYESEEGQKEFTAWRVEQEMKQQSDGQEELPAAA